MPKIKSAILVDTVLNEFVYTAIYKSSYDQKRALPDRYLKIAMDERLSRSFSEKSSKEEKEIVLTHLGYTHCYILNGHDPKVKLLEQRLSIPHIGKHLKLSKAISESGVYITTDRDLTRTLGLMSKEVHNPSYFINLEILRQGYHIKKWSKRYTTEKDLQYREVDELSRQTNKLFLKATFCIDKAKDIIGCSRDELRILMALYSSTTTVQTDEEFKNIFFGVMKNAAFARAIRGLMKTSLVNRMYGEISITSAGMKKVNSFMENVYNLNRF